MNEATITAPQQTQTPQAAEAPAEELTVEQRADALFGPDVTDDGEDVAATEEAAPAEAAPAAEKTPEQLAAERKARRDATLADLKAKTREGVDAKSARSEAESLRRQLERERQERAGLIDPRGLTPLQILELGQQAGHTPAQIAEALKAARENPELAAAHAARKVVDPEIQQLRQQLYQERQERERFEQQYRTAQERAEEDAAHQTMVSFASENAATAPYSSSFIKAHGAGKFRKAVEHVLSEGMVVGAGSQAVLDAVEDFLIEEYRTTQQGLSAWTPTAAAATQRTQANNPRSLGTATQAPTHVTQSLAQQRSSVVDEEAALQDLPYAERAAAVFRRH